MSMSNYYKVVILNHPTEGQNEFFATRPYLLSFDGFKEEIFSRIPELKDQTLKFFYEDSDGDRITIFNALDFGIFKELKISKVFVNKIANTEMNDNRFQEKAVTAPSIQCVTGNGDKPTRPLHHPCICDGCEQTVFGYRYKCLECEDFDLCKDCENTEQHSKHIMVRISDPNDGKILYGLRSYTLTLRQYLCNEGDNKANEQQSSISTCESFDSKNQCTSTDSLNSSFTSILSSASDGIANKSNDKIPENTQTDEYAAEKSETTREDIVGDATANQVGNGDKLLEKEKVDDDKTNDELDNEDECNLNLKSNSNDDKQLNEQNPFGENFVVIPDENSPESELDEQSNEQNPFTEHFVTVPGENSPTTEWTIVNTKGIEESDQPDGELAESTGTIPKKTPYSESSLNNDEANSTVEPVVPHIEYSNTQKADTLIENEKEKERNDQAAFLSNSDSEGSSVSKQVLDFRIDEALAAMIFMGFTNEGGWLTQLLENVDGSIETALDLLQPQN